MKNMKKLLQKAMVFTLSAAMLVGTPMTASAAGLVDLYSTSDGTGVVGDTGSDVTGTITNTDTNTGFLIENNKVSIVGIALDRETVDTEVGTQEILKATVVLDGKITATGDIFNEKDELIAKANDDITDKVVAEMSKKIEWKLLYTDKDGNIIPKMPNPADKVGLVLTAGSASDRSQVTLTPRAGTKDGEEVTVRASIDASYYYEQAKDDGKQNSNKLHLEKEGSREGTYYTADAKVSVKEYTNELSWSDGETGDTMQLKHTLDLGALLVRDPETANDAITWTSSNTKVATVSATGVVTAKKAGTETAPATADITAVSERGKVAKRTITVVQGQKADEVVIFVDGVETKGTVAKNLTSDSASRQMKNVTAEMYVKVKKAYTKEGVVVEPTDKSGVVIENIDGTLTNNVRVKSEQWYINAEGKAQQAPKITDTITWSSNKAAVATVDNKGVVSLKGVGTAAITAKATNGKSAKISVKVTADLNALAITNKLQKAYSGQTIQMDLERDPAENKDAVKWTVLKKDGITASKSATINAKGVLTIKNQIVAEDDEIIVKVETTKAVKPDKDNVKQKVSATTAVIKLEQSSIDGITVVEGTNTAAAPIAQVGLKDGKIKQLVKAGTSNINVPLTKTYTAKVDGADLGATLLTWKTNKPKVVSISGSGKSAKITALAPGKATITVSGVRTVTDTKGKVKASVISTKFTVQVKQPVTTLTMNKPAVTMVEKYKKVRGVPTLQNQKISLKVTFGPKNADKSQKVIDSWTIYKNGVVLEDANPVKTGKGSKQKTLTAASLSYTTKEAPKAGDEYKVVVKSITGATATSTVTIAAPTTKVQILDNTTNKVFNKNSVETKVGKPLSIRAQVQVGEAWLDAGSDKAKEAYAEDVTYTVNKKGIITVDKDGNVYPIKKGTVTITAKTPTGKKATLKVKVN